METPAVVERRFRADGAVTAELDASLAPSGTRNAPSGVVGPPPAAVAPGTANVIHTADGARDYGYQGALVAGVLLFGWCVPALMEVVGPGWLTAGWVEVGFRRPVYSGADLALRVEGQAQSTAETSVASVVASLLLSTDEGPCVQGRAGLGAAPWSAELADLSRRAVEPALAQADKPALTLETPAGDLRTLDATVSNEAASAFGRSQPEPMEEYGGDRPAVHPAILARQMISLLGHTYDYGRPSIHVSTHLQLLAPVPAGAPLALCGRLVETYERRGHEYAVTDGVLYGAGPQPLARLRHTNIFRVARRAPDQVRS